MCIFTRRHPRRMRIIILRLRHPMPGTDRVITADRRPRIIMGATGEAVVITRATQPIIVTVTAIMMDTTAVRMGIDPTMGGISAETKRI